MKKLKDILYKCRINRVIGKTDIPIGKLSFDSREIENDTAFIAIRGTNTDGHKYIGDVIQKGALAVVCEELPAVIEDDICYVLVDSSSETLGIMSSNFYDNPSESINLVGITGTNGKTTTVTLLYELYKSSGYKTGLISTVQNCIGDIIIPSTHTTPNPIQLNYLLKQMVDIGCEYCFMEVSSHAVVQNRISGLHFVGGIFSNLTHDHLDFHKTFKAYLEAKKLFFDKLPSTAFALINIDDKNGLVMVQNTRARVNSMAIKKHADFQCKILENQFDGLLLNINGKEVWSHLVGNFNAYNILAIFSTARLLGMSEEEALIGISRLRPVNGRFEYFKSPNNIIAIVDYAHTPDALKNVIDTINSIRQGNGRLITIVGAGGDRDKTKRPIMAKLASEGSNLVILTSDNPRNEDPNDILNEMSEGVTIDRKRYCLIISDRLQAIRTAYTMATAGDILLIAGKGHETYQEIRGVRHHFDDKEVIVNLFNESPQK